MQPAPSPALSVDKAVAALTQGGVIAYPTEAVWGLGCDPRQEAAVLRLLAIKRRPVDKGVIVVAASMDVLHEWVDFDALEPARKQEGAGQLAGPAHLDPASHRTGAALGHWRA